MQPPLQLSVAMVYLVKTMHNMKRQYVGMVVAIMEGLLTAAVCAPGQHAAGAALE